MTRAVQVTPARWDVIRYHEVEGLDDQGAVIACIIHRTEGPEQGWWVNSRTSSHGPSRSQYATPQTAAKKCGWLKVDEWVPLPELQPPTGVAEALSAVASLPAQSPSERPKSYPCANCREYYPLAAKAFCIEHGLCLKHCCTHPLASGQPPTSVRCAHGELEPHDIAGLYEPGKPAHHGYGFARCAGPDAC